jgi:hypothetical protein
MKIRLNPFKFIVLIAVLIFHIGCNAFGPDVTGIWLISGSGDAKMQLVQSGAQIQGLASYQGQLEGQVYGQLTGTNIILQVRRTSYSGIVSYTGIVSSDGNSMQLRRNDGQILTMFRTS